MEKILAHGADVLQLLKTAPVGIISIDSSGQIIFANDYLEDLLGYSAAELMQRTLIGITYEEDALISQEILQSLKEGLQTEALIRKRYRHKDGSVIDCHTQLMVTGEDKFIASIKEVNQQDTLQRMIREVNYDTQSAQRTLEKINRTLSDVQEMARLGTWTAIMGQPYVSWSSMVYEIHEVPMGTPIRLEDGINYYHPDHIPIIEEAFFNCVEKGERYDEELIIITQNGLEKWVRALGHPIWENDEIVGAFGVFQDIDSRKRGELTLEEKAIQLNDLAERLKEKNKELEHFNYMTSHDLQEPLRAISNFSSLLLEECATEISASGQLYLDYILKGANRMTGLVTSMLDYGRLGRKSEREDFEVGDVVSEVLQDLSTVLEESGAVITQGELPSIYGYKREFRMLLQNLVANALKFRKEGTIPHVHIDCQPIDRELCFSVRDNGIGIEEYSRQKIFLMFQRGHDNKGSFKGEGIGLAHCRKIADMHGGTIWVESVLGEGSTFKVLIPNLNKH
ncbi:MAG: ATP-binding protein [Bacteroidota bacterium]